MTPRARVLIAIAALLAVFVVVRAATGPKTSGQAADDVSEERDPGPAPEADAWRSDRSAPAHRPRDAFDEAEARARAAGFATTWDEWVPEGKPDGWLPLFHLAIASAAIELRLGRDLGLPEPWTSPLDDVWATDGTDEQRAALGGVVAEYADLAAALRDAATAPAIGFGRWKSANPEPRLLHHLIAAPRALEARVRCEAVPEKCAAAAADCIRFTARFEPRTCMEANTAAAYAKNALRAVRVRIESGRLTAGDVRKTLEPELRLVRSPSFDWWCRAEVVYLCGLVRGSSEPAVIAGGARLLDANVAIAQTPPGTDVERRVAGQAKVPTELQSRTALMMLQCRPRLDAVVQLARVALAAKERRETTGTWPASLADLATDLPDGVPTDPFTDAPFEYAVTAESVRIASRGCWPDEKPRAESTLRENGLAWVMR